MKSSSSFETSRLSADCRPENSKIMSIISTLPNREGIIPSYDYYQYQGFWLPLVYLEAALSLHENFKAQPSDIFLCSSPKTGTTWLKALTFSIITRDLYDNSTNPLLTKVSHECLPLLEVDYSNNPTFLDNELPLLSTHLPYTLLPKSILDSNCKIIYICREPKDTFVSLWHYTKTIEERIINIEAGANPITLEQEFKWFCESKSAYGPYWDHVLEYWKASVERPHRVFFLKYEDLKSNTLSYVKKLADFMEKPFSMEEERRGVPEEIVARCHIKHLSSLEVNKNGYHRSHPEVSNSVYYRKGETGDWKNLLTEDMGKLIDQITQEKFQSLGLTFATSTQSEIISKN